MGHAYTADSTLDEKSEALENALYVALNTLEESAVMADRLASRSRALNQNSATRRFEERVENARRQAQTIRKVLLEGGIADAV